MTSNQMKAIERALGEVLSGYISELCEDERKRIPHKAVRLAQSRAKREYDFSTKRQALEYARSLLIEGN